MSAVHNVFHISLIRKCLEVPEKTEVFKNIDHRTIESNDDLTYPEAPIRILDHQMLIIKNIECSKTLKLDHQMLIIKIRVNKNFSNKKYESIHMCVLNCHGFVFHCL